MSKNSNKGKDDHRKPRRGEETVLRSVPVGERIKRAKGKGLGGNKAIFFLSIFAAVLAIAIIILVVNKFSDSSTSSQTEPEPPAETTELISGTIITSPADAEVYVGDSLLGITPLAFSMAKGEKATIKHQCCPDTIIEVNSEQMQSAPLKLMTWLQISSDPAGAQIVINGESTDKITPDSMIVAAADTFDLELRMKSKRTLKTGSISLTESDLLSTGNIEITNLDSSGFTLAGSFSDKPSLLIKSAPSGVEVRLTKTGKPLGRTPGRFEFGDAGFSITLTKEGFQNLRVNIPSSTTRKTSYTFYLYRAVKTTAYEAGNTEKTINCLIKDVIYDNNSHQYSEITPCTLYIPGKECRIIFEADGYYNTDTLISASQTYIAAVMVKREPSTDDESSSDTQTTTGIPTGKAEVKIFVTDKKNVAIPGVTLQSEYKVEGGKEIIEIGKTDQDGKYVAYLSPGKHKLIAKHLDYKKGDKTEKVKAGESYIITIKIKRR